MAQPNPIETASHRPLEVVKPRTKPGGREFTRRDFLKLTALGAAGLALEEGERQYGAVSAGVNWAKNLLENRTDPLTNPLKETGVINKNNTIASSITEVNQLLEIQKREGLSNETTLFFPLRLPAGWNGIPYAFDERAIGFDPKTGKPVLAKDKNRLFLSNIPEKTEICAPTDGVVYSYFGKDGSVQGIGMEFSYGGINYTLKIAGLINERIFSTNGDIPSMDQFIKGGRSKTVKRGDTIMTVVKGGKTIQIEFTSTPSGAGKNQENPVVITFLTTGGKLLVPK